MLHLKAHLRFHFTEYLQLHKNLMVHLSVQLRMQEGASKISFYGALATAQEVDGPFFSAIETAPEGKLKLYLKIHLAIYIKTHKKVDLGLHLRLHLRVHLRLHLS